MRMRVWMAATVVLLGGSTLVQGQTSGTVRDDLFAGTEKFAQNASSVTEVDMDPDTLGMVNGSNSSRARRTVLSVVHTYSYDKPGMYNMADVEAFRNKLNTGDWHCSVHVRELKSGESTDVCQKRRSDGLQEQAIITVEPKELTFIHTIRRPSTPSTPGTPATPGRPGGGESYWNQPESFGSFSVEGLPSWAWAAEMRANGAAIRAEGAIQRAEMAAMRPEMQANMAEMRANMAGMMPEVRMDLFSAGSWGNGQPIVDEGRIRDLTRRLLELPNREEIPMIPVQPKAPRMPTPNPGQSSGGGASGGSGSAGSPR